MIWKHQKPYKFFSSSHIIYRSRCVIDDQFLGNLAESISHKGINLIEIVRRSGTTLSVAVVWITGWNSILIGNAISQIGNCEIQNHWRPHALWITHLLVGSTTIVASDSKRRKVEHSLILFEITYGTHFDFTSPLDFLIGTHLKTGCLFDGSPSKLTHPNCFDQVHIRLDCLGLVIGRNLNLLFGTKHNFLLNLNRSWLNRFLEFR